MPLLTKELQNKQYVNWLKACIALKWLAERLVDFLVYHIRKQHDSCLNKIKKKYGDLVSIHACTACRVETIKPAHDHDRYNRCPLNHPNCNCMRPNGKRACPNNICSEMYDNMIMLHKTRNPSWQNTNVSEWYNNCWEIAKCCIPRPGYIKKKSAIETNCVGLLSIVINNTEIQNHLQCIVNEKTDIFTKTRDKSHVMLHSSNELGDDEFKGVIDDCILILRDPKELLYDAENQSAVLKLRQLKQEDCLITVAEERCIIEETISEIEQMKIDALQAIQNKNDAPVKLMDTKANKMDTRMSSFMTKLKNKLTEIDTHKALEKWKPTKQKQSEEKRLWFNARFPEQHGARPSFADIMKEEEMKQQKEKTKRSPTIQRQTTFHSEVQETLLDAKSLRIKLYEIFPQFDDRFLDAVLCNHCYNLPEAIEWINSYMTFTKDTKQSTLLSTRNRCSPNGQNDYQQQNAVPDTKERGKDKRANESELLCEDNFVLNEQYDSVCSHSEDTVCPACNEINDSNLSMFAGAKISAAYWRTLHSRDKHLKQANKEFDRGRIQIGSYYAMTACEETKKVRNYKREAKYVGQSIKP